MKKGKDIKITPFPLSSLVSTSNNSAALVAPAFAIVFERIDISGGLLTERLVLCAGGRFLSQWVGGSGLGERAT